MFLAGEVQGVTQPPPAKRNRDAYRRVPPRDEESGGRTECVERRRRAGLILLMSTSHLALVEGFGYSRTQVGAIPPDARVRRPSCYRRYQPRVTGERGPCLVKSVLIARIQDSHRNWGRTELPFP